MSRRHRPRRRKAVIRPRRSRRQKPAGSPPRWYKAYVELSAAAPPAPGTLARLWTRRRALLVGTLTALALSAAVWLIALRISDWIRSARDGAVSAAVAERLILDIDHERAPLSPQRLGEHLPAVANVPGGIRRAVQAASASVGVDGGYLLAVAARESGFDAAARASQSTAAGLYQFTDDTWLRVVKLFGQRHGLAGYAERIDTDERGAVALRDGALRAKLLQLRFEPEMSALMAAELALDNRARLERLLGRAVTPAEIYIAHFMGVGRAAKMIDAARTAPGTIGASLFPAAAESNPGVFMNERSPVSVRAIVDRIEAYFATTVSRAARG